MTCVTRSGDDPRELPSVDAWAGSLGPGRGAGGAGGGAGRVEAAVGVCSCKIAAVGVSGREAGEAPSLLGPAREKER